MRQRFLNTYDQYPRQFWLMAFGLLIMSSGASMVWPFLMIYVSNTLSLPLSKAASLITINASAGLISTLIAGSVADRFGRKLVMTVSLLSNGFIYLFMAQADSYAAFAVLMMLAGFANPLYAVGADAMLADLLPVEKRTDGYAMIRMFNNAGVAIGPAIGGFVASRSYDLAFYGAAAGMLSYGFLLLFMAKETLDRAAVKARELSEKATGGFKRVLQDKGYLAFTGLVALGLIAPAMLWGLLAVYTNQNYGLSEQLYGWIPTTNALMCVFIQLPVTQITKRYRPLMVITVGMMVYALGVGSVALMAGFWGFWISMVILTFGELIMVPTASKYVADRAPIDLRGRYMSIFWLTQGISRAIAPLYGGWLNDNISPKAIWAGGLGIGLSSTMGLFALSKRMPEQTEETVTVDQATGH
jgi:MFS family permease